MAFVRDEYCRICEYETLHTNNKCNKCSEREHHEAMEAWQAKTVDEKLLDLLKRVQILERGPPRYS